MKPRLLIFGMIVWIVATALLRITGERLLEPASAARTLILFAASFPPMAIVARFACRTLPREQRLQGAVSFALPTLFLDPFSSAFFTSVFPNMDPGVAGIFGGWMLWCCAAALTGVMIGNKHA